MQWCLQRVPGREARHRRVPVLFEYFKEFFTDIKIITVAGTAGKGSTCHMLEAVTAGREAFLAGPMEQRDMAAPSTPLIGKAFL